MNISRFVVLLFQIYRTHKHMIPVNMIGQSKINVFFKRQSSSGEDRLKSPGSIRDDNSECTLPLKRKRDENITEV